MTTPQLITKAVNRQYGSRSSAPKRLYVFAVTSLTCFLICQMIWHKPITGYVAFARVEYDYTNSLASSPPREASIQKLLAPDSELDYILDQVDHLRSYIRIRTTESSADRTAYEIRLVGTTPDEATKLTNAVAGHLAGLSTSREDIQSLSLKNAESELLSLRDRENQLRQRLSIALSGHCNSIYECLANAEKAKSFVSERQDQTPVAVEETEPETPAERVNPQWVKLHDELTETQQKIEELKVLRTEQHPLVKTLGYKALEIKDRLSRTPPTLVPTLPAIEKTQPATQPKAVPVTVAVQSQDAVLDAVTSMSGDLQQQLMSLTQLSESIEDLKAVRLAAEDNLIRIAAERPKESHAKVAITPATVVASIGGKPSLHQIAWIMLAAATFGGAVSILAVRPLASNVPQKTNDAQMPDVEIVLSENVLSKQEKLSPLRRSAVATTHICEFALVGIVGLVLLIALSDSPLAAGFPDAPFQTLSEVIQRITP